MTTEQRRSIDRTMSSALKERQKRLKYLQREREKCARRGLSLTFVLDPETLSQTMYKPSETPMQIAG